MTIPPDRHHRAATGALMCVLVILASLSVTSPVGATQTQATATIALHLKDGTVLIGHILSEDDGTIRFRSPALGDITVAAGDVESRGPVAGADVPTGARAAESAAAAAKTAPPAWNRTIGIAAFWNSAPFTQGTIGGSPPGVTGAAMGLPGAQFRAEVNASASYSRANTLVSSWGRFTYTESEPTGRLAEATSLGLQFMVPLGSRTFLSSRATFDRDVVRHIDHSFAELLGIGVKVVQRPRLRASIVAGGGLVIEYKNTQFDGTYQPQVGAMESIAYDISPRASLSHWLIYRVGTRQAEIWCVESYTGLQGAITSRFSIDIGLTWNYDNILGAASTLVPAGALVPGSPALVLRASQKTVRQITSGLKFTF